ncbi:MAG: hypothetical protein AB7I27_19045 [Bacteriovoracaceae bacterium]
MKLSLGLFFIFFTLTSFGSSYLFLRATVPSNTRVMLNIQDNKIHPTYQNNSKTLLKMEIKNIGEYQLILVTHP